MSDAIDVCGLIDTCCLLSLCTCEHVLFHWTLCFSRSCPVRLNLTFSCPSNLVENLFRTDAAQLQNSQLLIILKCASFAETSGACFTVRGTSCVLFQWPVCDPRACLAIVELIIDSQHSGCARHSPLNWPEQGGPVGSTPEEEIFLFF